MEAEKNFEYFWLAMKKAVLAIDIGGTNTKIGIVSNEEFIGEVISIPSDGGNDLDQYTNALLDAANKVKYSNHNAIDGIGIGVAGFVDESHSRMIFNPNIGWLENFPLADFFGNAFNQPVFVEVDSNAAALAEAMHGNGQDSHRLLVLTVGTGLGGGMIIDGEILRISNQCLGDIGHVIVEPGGLKCASGCGGCAEAYVSSQALEDQARKLAIQNPSSELGTQVMKNDHITAREVITLAKRGEQYATAAIEVLGHYLGLAISSMAPIFMPDTICIAGGISEAGSILIEATNKSFHQHVGLDYGKEVEIKKANFGWQAVLIGAASAFKKSQTTNTK
ncbi:ROK family protein [Chloroflexota bacterium]